MFITNEQTVQVIVDVLTLFILVMGKGGKIEHFTFSIRSVYLAVLLDKMGAMMVLPLLPFIARSSLARL